MSSKTTDAEEILKRRYIRETPERALELERDAIKAITESYREGLKRALEIVREAGEHPHPETPGRSWFFQKTEDIKHGWIQCRERIIKAIEEELD